MQISNIKINGYGKIENKEIELKNGINIINGSNEAGKSTILSFIHSMFFGASKNKNGKEISNYDKYKPWSASEFSGKINYCMDNGEKFEVFRDFNKKNPQIYNENLENISDRFSIDKTNGNQFFVEQTGIEEKLFLNTMTISQSEIVLDQAKQNDLIQKITNTVSSGDETTSYKKTIDKLNKKLIDEVGTSRTSGRPLNLVEEEISSIENSKNELETYKNKIQYINNDEDELKNELERVENELNILKEVKEYKQLESIEEQKINIIAKNLNDYNNKLNELNQKTPKKIIKKKCINPIILLVIFIAVIGLSVLFKKAIVSAVIGIVLGILYFINYCMYSKQEKILKDYENENIKHNKEIDILKENIKKCNEEIQSIREEIEIKQNKEKEYIKNKYGAKENVDEYVLQSIEEISTNKDKMQNRYQEIMIKNNSITIEKNNISDKLENLAKQEERVEFLYEQKEELESLSRCIKLAEIGLEEAYTTMKNTITPKFTNELTKIISNITNEKYTNIKFNDVDGLIVELENGEYVKCNRLSTGTIDQMYLALRLSILNEVSKEVMPIILDEAFVYYDNSRLENILTYITNEYKDRQIIIFTCTNREIEALDNLNVQYNLVNI